MERLEWRYVNGIVAKRFDEEQVLESKGQIKEIGWYWADQTDNARYSDWKGVYHTEKEALMAGKEIRAELVGDMLTDKTSIATFRWKFATLTKEYTDNVFKFEVGDKYPLAHNTHNNDPSIETIAKRESLGIYMITLPSNFIEIEEELLIAKFKVGDCIILTNLNGAIPYVIQEVKCDHGRIYYHRSDGGCMYEDNHRLATTQEMQSWGRGLRKPEKEIEIKSITENNQDDT